MKTLHSELGVGARAEIVWEVLSDLPGWERWNPVMQVQGDLAQGERLQLTIAPPGGKPVRIEPTVSQLEEGRQMRWLSHVLFRGVLDIEQGFRVTAEDVGRCRLEQFAVFRGLLSDAVLWRNRKPIEMGFQAMNRSLKREAERVARGARLSVSDLFFPIAKIAWFVVQPSSILLLLLLLGIVLLWTRFAWVGRWIALTAALLLLIAGLSPLGNWLVLPLEERFSRAQFGPGEQPAGIIVLGGAQDTMVSTGRDVIAINEAGERIVEAVALARRFPGAKIVFTGGTNQLIYESETEAAAAKTFFDQLGIPSERVLLEDRARDTYENAQLTQKLVQPKRGERWLLVTSANHMPRAVGSFRAAGFDVEPWPVDYRTRGPEDIWRFFDKPSEGLRRIDKAMREWVGLAVLPDYRAHQCIIPAALAGLDCSWEDQDMPQEIKIGFRQLVDQARARVEELTADQVLEVYDDPDVVIVDIRDIRELKNEGKIPGAFHCPRGVLEFWIDPASPYFKEVFAQDKKFIFHCAGGWRSALAADIAQTMGLKPVAHLYDGFKAWKKVGGPIEQHG